MIHQTMYLSKRAKVITAMEIFRIGLFRKIMRKNKVLRTYVKAYKVLRVVSIKRKALLQL